MTAQRLAVTLGDPAGIGPEVLVKAFAALPEDPGVTLFVLGWPGEFVAWAMCILDRLSCSWSQSLQFWARFQYIYMYIYGIFLSV